MGLSLLNKLSSAGHSCWPQICFQVDFEHRDLSILKGFANYDQFPPLPTGEKILPPTPKFDRLVLVLIDALRRYAILNIADSDTSSTLKNSDNWLVQMKINGNNKSISFFGDDTWIKLFPGIFDITDGTTSFFATDTVEVDLNVTRNIKPQLLSQSWEVLIFHYLGLDHIGHSSGPHSPLMRPKQHEMDKVIKTIFEIIKDQDSKRLNNNPNSKPTLLVLCGDHGMNEAGNHGGSSAGEISTALLFISFEKLRLLQLNSYQLAGILKSTWKSFDRNPDISNEPSKDICSAIPNNDQERLQCFFNLGYYYHKKALFTQDKDHIQKAFSSYDKFINESRRFSVIWFAMIGMNHYHNRHHISNQSEAELFSVIGTLVFCITMFASSYIEEEHQFCLNSSGKMKSNNKLLLFLIGQLVLVRFIRIWNQTGNSNSLASIDISNAYTGVEEYN
ncbi:9380_t:CDS:10 [Entrophospora sp. SA101]|nr:9380_t:CDS:10 [Entrophospora sp. SA101]